MTAALTTANFTPDDLLKLEDEGLFELVDGNLVEKTMSSVASKVAGIVTYHLVGWTNGSSRGEVFPEQTFRCFPHDPDLVRRPDLALILAERLAGVEPEGDVSVVPDLAVEVISPNDRVYMVDEKLIDYRSAGVKSVWVINPASRRLLVYHADRTITELGDSDIVTDSVLPGFSVPLAQLLPAKAKA